MEPRWAGRQFVILTLPVMADRPVLAAAGVWSSRYPMTDPLMKGRRTCVDGRCWLFNAVERYQSANIAPARVLPRVRGFLCRCCRLALAVISRRRWALLQPKLLGDRVHTRDI